jgi:hypothetical protein
MDALDLLENCGFYLVVAACGKRFQAKWTSSHEENASM